MPFEFVIDGPPVSQQAKRRSRVKEWTKQVHNVAETRWDTASPFVGEVMVTITYLYEGASLDVDNMSKPILDALKGLVYSDDAQVSEWKPRWASCRASRLICWFGKVTK